MQIMTEATYTIKAGTVVKINGIPVEVLRDTPAFTAPENVPLIENGEPWRESEARPGDDRR